MTARPLDPPHPFGTVKHCPKCRARSDGTYGQDPATVTYRVGSEGERLERECQACHFVWSETVADDPTNPPKPGPPHCPTHHEVQHRDGRAPWCDTCGWHHGRPATEAFLVAERNPEYGR